MKIRGWEEESIVERRSERGNENNLLDGFDWVKGKEKVENLDITN